MKANIHPKWFPETKVTCACGNTFTTGSILPEIRVEICSSCHPFFTGSEKVIDTAGRVEKFKTRLLKLKKSWLKPEGKKKPLNPNLILLIPKPN